MRTERDDHGVEVVETGVVFGNLHLLSEEFFCREGVVRDIFLAEQDVLEAEAFVCGERQ